MVKKTSFFPGNELFVFFKTLCNEGKISIYQGPELQCFHEVKTRLRPQNYNSPLKLKKTLVKVTNFSILNDVSKSRGGGGGRVTKG